MDDNIKTISFSFFKSPSVNTEKNVEFIQKVTSFIVCVILMYVLAIFGNLIISLITKMLTSININDLLLKNQNSTHFTKKFHENIIYVLLLGPFLEEIIFRLPLDLKKFHLTLSISTFCFLFVGDKWTHMNIYSFGTWIKYILILLVLVIFYNVKQKHLDVFREKYYGYFFYFLCISFGLMHITNFYKILPNNLIWMAPFFVLPQIFLGIFAGYIRIKNGFFWGLLMHIAFNTPTVLLYILKNYN
jgi:Type II CAAX prenyl endopeptidase Rce1-like